MKTLRSKDGTSIAYDIYGSGPALIYIAGAACYRSMKPVMKGAKVFSSEFSVYNYDRRGRGDSGNTLPYSPLREVEDIEALIDAAGGKAFVYGHSSGAVLALEAALSLPGKVQRVVLHDPSYAHNEAGQAEYARLSHGVCALLEDNKYAASMKKFLLGIGIPGVIVWLMRLSADWRGMVSVAPTLAYDIELTKGLPPVKRAAKLAVPAQILIGQKSPASLHAVAAQLQGCIPNVETIRLDGQDHLAKPEAVLAALINFMKAEV